MGQVKRHSLRRNDRTWTPHLVGFFDTEFPPDPAHHGMGQPFRCGAARVSHRHGKGARARQQVEVRTTDRHQLCQWLEDQTRGGVPLWLYAHHLSVDLVASGLLEHLLGSGWTLSRHALGNPHPWAVLVQGHRTIHLCDTVSLFMASEGVLGEVLGLPKGSMPEPQADDEAWLEYCWRDVEIGHRALTELLDEWDRRGLGNWTETGPGCGWNSLRHTIKSKTVWIDPDPEARAFERQAIYAGRRDVFRVGQLAEDEWCDLDLERAHTTVAATVQIPMGRGRPFDSLPVDHPALMRDNVGAIARCRVRTESSRYPLRLRRGIVHPPGEFWTILCGPELAEARRRGELLEVGAGYFYQLSLWSMSWANWVLRVLAGEEDDVSGLLKLMVKGWSKTVWGRSAMQVGGTVKEMDGPSEELHIERGRDLDADCRMVVIDYAWHRQKILQDQDWDDAFPAILAWIQSHVRVQVGRLVDALGEDAIAQVASDGVLVKPERLWEIASAAGAAIEGRGDTADVANAAAEVLSEQLAPYRVRLKDVLRRVRVAGPDHMEADGVQRLSGVPRGARRVGPWRYEGSVWPSLAVQTQLGSAGEVVIQPRVWDLSRVRPLRWVYEDGCCEPLRATLTAAGGGVAIDWPLHTCSRHGAALVASQHPAIAAAVDEAFGAGAGLLAGGLEAVPLKGPGVWAGVGPGRLRLGLHPPAAEPEA